VGYKTYSSLQHATRNWKRRIQVGRV